MIVWMRSHGGELKSGLEQRAGRALGASSPLALAALAFAAVGREGLETVLFLFASVSSAGLPATLIGGSAGLALAAAAGFALYQGSSRLNLKTFFAATGVLLIVFAAGIIAHVLGEAGELGLPAALTSPAWDTGAWLSDASGFGAVLKALFGYQAAPSLIQIIGYWAYLGAMAWLYLRPATRPHLVPAGEDARG
jgi:high-affinity iron transporter